MAGSMNWIRLLMQVPIVIFCYVAWRFSTAGVNILATQIAGQITSGPVANIIRNVNIQVNSTYCSLAVGSEATARRLAFESGPIKTFLEHVDHGSSLEKNMVSGLRSLLVPFDSSYEKSDEDVYLNSVVESARILAQRQRGLEGLGSKTENITDQQAHKTWQKFNSHLAQATARRYQYRCEEMFDKSLKLCIEKTNSAQARCYETAPLLVGHLICRKVNSLEFCHPNEVQKKTDAYCDVGNRFEGNMTPSEFDHKMGALSNVHDQIESQLRVNLHFHLTELPKMKHFVLVEELRIKKEALTHVGKAVLNIFQLLLSIISIGLCCQLLYKAIIKAIEDYTKLPEARTLAEFYTDENREKFNFWKLLASGFKLNIVIVFVIVVLIQDYAIYKLASKVQIYSSFSIAQSGFKNFTIKANGTGPLVDLLNDVLQSDFGSQIDVKLNNTHCLVNEFAPVAPSYFGNIFFILAPLLIIKFVIKPFLDPLIDWLVNYVLSAILLGGGFHSCFPPLPF